MSLGKKKPDPPATEPDDRDVTLLKWGAELQRELAQSVAGVLVRGARAVPVGQSPGAISRPATSGANSLMGFSLKNTSYELPCTVHLIDGESVEDGHLILEIELSPSESAREWFGMSGVSLSRGLVYHDPSGLTTGSVFLRGSDY
ncbi:hypothetical protein JOE61_003863 [Nocardioides salarius]|uniref:Uncharacterized protein n=1 Tax=Nocardioides salarius TaxID=374513 RepID=A0ABS2MFS7_9ACTN|nr:hypothetical protein [Nocardioides salarius]MBM7510049.1 hypothetical protein [Nocardioides salarius]